MAIFTISGTTASFVTQILEKFTIPEKRDRSLMDIIGHSIVTGMKDIWAG